MGKASHKTPTSRDGGVERAQWNNKAHATWLIKTPPSDKDVILSVMTRLSYATHDSQCTKQNMSLITNVEHNHFDPLGSTVYHNNILRHAAWTLDHFHTLPAKGTRNTALMSVSAEGISSYTHTHSLGGSPFTREREGLVSWLYASCSSAYARLVDTQYANHTCEDLATGWSEQMVGTVQQIIKQEDWVCHLVGQPECAFGTAPY